MDSRLQKRLDSWFNQIDKMKQIEEDYLYLKGNEKAIYSNLFLKSQAKTVASKEAEAYSHQDFIDFKNGLSKAEAELNHEERILDLKIKAYEAEYLTYKKESDALRKSNV